MGYHQLFVCATSCGNDATSCDTMYMYKQQVVQRLYNDAQGVRPCEMCGCRFDPADMKLHVQRYRDHVFCPCSLFRVTFIAFVFDTHDEAAHSMQFNVCAVTAERRMQPYPRLGHGCSPLPWHHTAHFFLVSPLPLPTKPSGFSNATISRLEVI